MNVYYLTEKEIIGFSDHLQTEEKSKNTKEKYLRDVNSFLSFAKNDTAGNQVISFENGEAENGILVTKETVIGYKQTLIEKGYAPRSINSMLASLHSLFSYLGFSELRVKSLKLQKQVFCSEEKELSKAEYEKLCRAARSSGNERLCLLLQTICGTGIRVSELQFITAEAVRKGEAVISLKGKTRRIFIVRDLQKKLLRYLKEQKIGTGAVFVTKTGKPMSRTNIWREMKSLCRIAEVDPEKVFPHNLRHLFARVFYGIEKDIAKLADILGHSSIETTRIYIISTGTEHRRRMERMRLIL